MQWYLVLLIWMGQGCAVVCQHYEYHLINEKKTWTEAQQYCREKHTDLATVINVADMERLLTNSAGDMREAWIGLYDQTSSSRIWHWSLPGVEFSATETNWNTNEPDDVGGMENCAMIWKNLKWGDISCNDSCVFLCYNDSNSSKKFHLIQEKKNWTEAQSYCRKHHTDLVSGLTQLKDEELKNECSPVISSTYIFTGLFRDTWKWSDGSSFSFRHWNLQFDNQKINSGECAAAVFDDEGRWKNEDCTARKPFICYDDKVILIKKNKTWEDALYYCRGYYDDLVTITNLDEQRWVQEKAKKASTDYVWMGLRYNCTLDFWFWVCKGMFGKKNWASDGWMNDCHTSGTMATRGQHRWFQRNDTEELNFICSKV